MLGLSNFYKRYTWITGILKAIVSHTKILSIATPKIQNATVGRYGFKKGYHSWPWFVSSFMKMLGKCSIHFLDMIKNSVLYSSSFDYTDVRKLM
jgi:hypothetical protein